MIFSRKDNSAHTAAVSRRRLSRAGSLTISQDNARRRTDENQFPRHPSISEPVFVADSHTRRAYLHAAAACDREYCHLYAPTCVLTGFCFYSRFVYRVPYYINAQYFTRTHARIIWIITLYSVGLLFLLLSRIVKFYFFLRRLRFLQASFDRGTPTNSVNCAAFVLCVRKRIICFKKKIICTVQSIDYKYNKT